VTGRQSTCRTSRRRRSGPGTPATGKIRETTPCTVADMDDWVEKYLVAWQTNTSDDIAALFSAGATYHEDTSETTWTGRDAIVTGWQSRWNGQQGGWAFDWSVLSQVGRSAVVSGVGHYDELGDFDNLWTIDLDEDGRCTEFDMVTTEQEAPAG
jgi:hypothetical protein